MHNYEKSKISVGIVGGSGYSGIELKRILARHPNVDLRGIYNSKTANLLNPSDYDVVFLATPADVSAELAPKFIQKGTAVIDLSGAYRLNIGDIKKTYQDWYAIDHLSPDLVAMAQYGLAPWLKPSFEKGKLIANPGCYATSILMGLLPLLSTSLIVEDSIVIDAKSGTTGAGKKPVESQIFSEVDGECLPYKVGTHQHLPEIKTFSKIIANSTIDPFFTTSLLPIRRGIIAGIYAKIKNGKSVLDVTTAFKEFYANYPFVTIYSEIAREGVSLKAVVGTPHTHISFSLVGDKLYVFSCIDNLLKGAASQAVENLNYLYNLPVTTGLDHLEAII